MTCGCVEIYFEALVWFVDLVELSVIRIRSILTEALKLFVSEEIIFFWLSLKSIHLWRIAVLIFSSLSLFSLRIQVSLRARIASLISFLQRFQSISSILFC